LPVSMALRSLHVVEQRKSKPLMAGEVARDESLVGEERLKVAMFMPVLDQLIMQLNERFSNEQVGLMKEITLISSGALKRDCTIRSSDIENLTRTYGLDAEAIVT